MTPYDNLRKRLIPDTYAELDYFLDLFKKGEIPGSYSAMEHHFAVAKKKPADFLNHKPVLALSFGGSNTKVMIASMRNGYLQAEYVRAQSNPEKQTAFYDYLDEIILRDPKVDRYLRETPQPEIGVSIPMLLRDDCPIHPTKIPTIDGFIARGPEEVGPALAFRDNFFRYMKSRGYTEDYRIFYQSDGIVAHHGAVSMSDAALEDKTVLCVCGTGMATGDEKHYLPIALVCNLPEDDQLFPPEETENRQLHYAIAGKGLFSLMRRTIETKVSLGGSALEGKNLRPFFETAKDTRNVFEICQCAMGLPYTDSRVEAIREAAGEEGFTELEELSRIIVQRVCETLANTVLATFISMGALGETGSHVVYLEGSIARNPAVKAGMLKNMHQKIAQRTFCDFEGNKIEFRLVEDPPLRPVQAVNDTVRPSDVDTTLMGTASMIMAECCSDND